MTYLYPLFPSLVFSNCAGKMEKLDRITLRVSYPGLWVSGVLFTSTISTSFSRYHTATRKNSESDNCIRTQYRVSRKLRPQT